MFCAEVAGGVSGASGDMLDDRVMLNSSIISCSFVVLVGSGGSRTINALMAGSEGSPSPTWEAAGLVFECLKLQRIKVEDEGDKRYEEITALHDLQ